MRKKIAVWTLMMLTLAVWDSSLIFGVPHAVFAADQEQTQESPAAPVPAQIHSEPVQGSTFELPKVWDKEQPLALINNNVPDFYIWQISPEPYVSLSPLDELGRTGDGMACLGKETLPTQARGQIGDIKPSGWHTVRYDDLIEDRYLYNRCHVLGYQLSGGITDARYMNGENANGIFWYCDGA